MDSIRDVMEAYFVVIYGVMADHVGSHNHCQPGVYERGSDSEVDDPVCPPPPMEQERMNFWP
jgi:hypothetical protein